MPRRTVAEDCVVSISQLRDEGMVLLVCGLLHKALKGIRLSQDVGRAGVRIVVFHKAGRLWENAGSCQKKNEKPCQCLRLLTGKPDPLGCSRDSRPVLLLLVLLLLLRSEGVVAEARIRTLPPSMKEGVFCFPLHIHARITYLSPRRHRVAIAPENRPVNRPTPCRPAPRRTHPRRRSLRRP